MQFSEQQQTFLDWAVNGTGSCVLEAVAGAGKTTVLLEAAEKMPGQVALLAYNKRIAEEIKEKLKRRGVDWKKAQGGTVHSFGFSAYRKTFKDPIVDENKVSNILDTMFTLPGSDRPNHEHAVYNGVISKLVSLAKQRAIGIHGNIDDTRHWWDIIEHFDLFEEEHFEVAEDLIKHAQTALKKSNQTTNIIDFDDMVYLPVLLKVNFWRFDVVMVDEAQDTNPARRALVAALVKKGGRVIAVGDRHQAIYGFTGADNDSLQQIARDFDCVNLPLTTTFRCPKEVVRVAQQWVNHIEAHETAPEGKCSTVRYGDFFSRDDLDNRSAVLCRVNKPLVELAFKLIRKRIPCRVEGRDIANGIKKLMQRWKIKDLDDLEDRLDAYLERETTKLLAKKQESRLMVIEDTVETIRVIIDQCRKEGKRTIADAIAYVDELFSDGVKDVLVLSSIHKSKGREWPNVFWLDRANTCPSPWARQEWQQEQEVNLCYVAATRAQEHLIELLAPSEEAKETEESRKAEAA